MAIQRRSTPTGRDLHTAWLELIDTEGPFLALPPLLQVWPQGMPRLNDGVRVTLSDRKRRFDRAWDTWDAQRTEAATEAYRTERDAWVDVILSEVLGWGEMWSRGDAATSNALIHSPDHSVSLQPTGVMRHEDQVAVLVWVIDPVSDLRAVSEDDWATSPVDRMELMLKASGIPIGVVTDGRWWGLVSDAPDTLAASGIFDAQTWIEEPTARDALVALLAPVRLVGGEAENRLTALFASSVLAAEEITEALGVQVRQAVELVVQAFSESAEAARQRGEDSSLPVRDGQVDGDQVYEAVVTTMMRVVFLLFAEERGLLPQGELFEKGYGLTGQLDRLEQRARHQGDDALDRSFGTWHRLLATSQALHQGATFEDLRLPAYGGSLFDPARFPFLTAVTSRGSLALPVSDRVMLQVLRALQFATVNRQERRLSFRDIDVEQIGYIYEGLLGYTCVVADEVVLGLIGKQGSEPEITLESLNNLYDEHGTDARTADAVIAQVKEDQPGSVPPTKAALTRAFAASDGLEDAERALRAVTSDEDLREELRPWLGAIRRDLRGWPVVVLPGGLLVRETPSRRNAGAHYTPRELAEEIVQHALEPLVYSPGPHQGNDPERWVPLGSTDLLGLRVADIACGSGAFLVAAGRYLAARLVEAWRREGVAEGYSPAELETRAVREVVANCLYGADINAMAVEMCKLSLWLVSLDPKLPFSFVDDKVLHGNSLLGVTDLRQLEDLHVRPRRGPQQSALELVGDRLVDRLDLDHRIEQAVRLRRQLSDQIVEHDPQRSGQAKRAQLRRLHEVTADLRLIADAVIAAGLRVGGKPGRALDEAYENLRAAVARAFPASGTGDRTALKAMADVGLTPEVETDYARWQPLHWALEVPDVMRRGGFDAIVGNPPFLGGKKLSPAMGQNLREWFVNQLAGGTKGNADLVAYFFLRAQCLLTPRGTMGLIATNTIAQGDTREVGLDRMVNDGMTITRAIQSRPWPAKSANLEYAAVWATNGPVADGVPRVSDDVPVRRISTLLEPSGRVTGNPLRLAENLGIAFQGCIVLGKGFVIDPPLALAWLDDDPRNAEVLFPYLNGDDLNSRPDGSASRWVIDFGERTEEEARQFEKPWNHVTRYVRPERLKQNAKKYPRMVNEWWKFWNARPGMRRTIAGLSSVIALPRVSSTQMPSKVSTEMVFSEQVVVFATASDAFLSVQSCSMHQLWTVQNTSTMGAGIRYAPSDAFETFPRPADKDVLRQIGRTLDEERREVMLRRDLGLTKLYNLVNDPDISVAADADVARLREIHVELDHAVMHAYGWGDVTLAHGFHTYRQMTRWTVSPAARVEILDRLLEENHRRAALQGDVKPALYEDEKDEVGSDAG
ncbi:type II restriction endonuclease subunit M [Serinicoccus chungangensis]|uniref:site-specific DNA-methyltransferase (adenine-specific) n=1 Tax=Serinicoccus chungangensis TaxID=767452 RepID=A0A0W8I5W2_9MICO|nr:DNA methyltransferase [Serinicoccus chungangensis]KUG53401.1 type II restriction endonuclease subunit M [Serinicoccus chungangensis]